MVYSPCQALRIMYKKIRQALIDRGWDEWMAGMTAQKIDDIGAETIRDILNEILG